MAPFDLCMSVCISEPWATYSKQLIGHKFCLVCGGNLFLGNGVYPPPPPRGGGGHLATVPPGVGGNRHPWGGMDMGGGKPPPPRVQEPPCARTAPWFRGRIFHITFFCQGNGFFMVLVDVGQLFRCAGQHFMCVATRPPIRGDPISQSQSHIPLKPLPPAFDPFPEATSP